MANEGNQFGVALKDPAIRQKAYKSFCDHLANGNSIKSWSFKEDGHLCCYVTMQKYIEQNPHEFSPIHKIIAESDGYALWEKEVSKSAKGINKDANTASLQMIMRNKYGWDKKEENPHSSAPLQNEIDKDHKLMQLEHEKAELTKKLEELQKQSSCISTSIGH